MPEPSANKFVIAAATFESDMNVVGLTIARSSAPVIAYQVCSTV